jgi:hypothetical protein
MLKRLFDLRGFMAAFLLAVTLTACASFGVPPAETFKQNLALSVLANTAIRETATTLLQTKKLDPHDAENILKQTDVAREGLNVARSLGAVDLASAQGRLDAINATLKGYQKYLLEKQGASK